jgi:hypothetical protein
LRYLLAGGGSAGDGRTMNAEQVFAVALFSSLVTLIVGFLTPIVQGILARRKVASETNFNYASAWAKLLEGSGDNTEAAIQLMEQYQKQNAALVLQIAELKALITSVQIDDTAKMARMQMKIDGLRSRVSYLEKTLQESSIPFEPQMDKDLLDSDPKIKAVK